MTPKPQPCLAGLALARDDAVTLAALVYGVGAAAVLPGTRRDPHAVAHARQLAIYLVHVGLGISQRKVGHLFGRDRASVAHACAVIEDRRDERRFDALLDTLEELIAARHRRAGQSSAPDPAPAAQSLIQPRLVAGFSFGPGPPERWVEVSSLAAPFTSSKPSVLSRQHQ